MENSTCGSTVSVVCSDERGPLPRCRAALYDARGRLVSESETDRCGRARLTFGESGFYEILAAADACHSPRAQSCWVRLQAGRSAFLSFFFRLPICPPCGKGVLQIRLCDSFYPNLTLSEGVYSLWRKF